MDAPDIIGIIGGLAGIATAISLLIQARANRRKIHAEASQLEAGASEKISDSAINLMSKYELRLAEVEKDLITVKDDNCRFQRLLNSALRRIEALMKGIKILIEQLEGNHIQPAWRPDDWEIEDVDG
jgi:hypothetical protein